MKKSLYMEVTRDALQLPLLVADSAKDLERMTGVPRKYIWESLCSSKRAKHPRFVRVEVDEDEQD